MLDSLKKQKVKHVTLLFVLVLLSLFNLLPLNIESFGGILIIAFAIFWFPLKLNCSDLKFIVISSGFYIFSIITLLYSNDFGHGANVISRGISFILIPTAFCILNKNINLPKVLGWYYWGYTLSLLILSFLLIYFLITFFEIYSFAQFKLVLKSWNFKYSLESGFYKEIHPTYFSMAILLGMWITVQKIRLKRPLFNKLLKAFIITTFIGMILILRSRIVIIALVLSLLVYFIKFNKIFRSKSSKLILLIVFIISLLLIYTSYNQSVNNSSSEIKHFNEDFSRGDIYSSCFELINENIVFGVGIGDVKHELIKVYKEKGFLKLYKNKFFNTHNQYMHYMASGGILNVIILICMLLILLKKSLATNDYVYFNFLLIISLVLLTENIFSRINGIYIFSLFNSIFYFSNKSLNARHEE